MTTLSTTSSIVDYLSTQGKDSSYTARQKLYKDLGLESRLGSYTGSGAQNTNLLNTLKGQLASSSIASFANPQPLVQPQVTPQTFTPTPTTAVNTYNTASQVKPATNAVNTTQNADQVTAIQKQLADLQAQKTALEQNNLTDTSQLTKNESGQYIPSTGGTSAVDVLNQIGKQPTPEELKAQVENDPAYKLYMEALGNKTRAESASAEAKKQQLETTYEADKTKLENNLAQNGLAFSGIRSQDVKALTDSLASSTLAVDRETAASLLEADVNARGKFLDIATGVIKEAAANNKDAIEQLNKAGYAVVGNTLVPTVESQRFAETQAQNEAAFQQKQLEYQALTQQRQFDNDVKVKQLQIQAQNAITSQERNAILDQIRLVNLTNMTAVSPGQVVNKATGLPVKLNAAQATEVAGFSNIISTELPGIRNALSRVTTGGMSGRYMSYAVDIPGLQ